MFVTPIRQNDLSSETTSKRTTSKTLTKTGEKLNFYPRYQYSKHNDFLFSCLGTVVGFNNIWLFPAMAAKYGGISFLFVCVIYAVLIGIPLCCLEMFLGQLSGVGIGKTFGLMSPVFQGVGWAMICMTFVQSLQYTVYISYCIFYLTMSFFDHLWWSSCDHPEWATSACVESVNLSEYYMLYYNCLSGDNFSNECTRPVLSTEEFYYNFVLDVGPTNKSHGQLSWKLMLTLFFAWCTVGFFLGFGIKISSKLAYVTVVFPYVGLLLVFIVCIIQDGALNGLETFFMPEYNTIFSAEIWIDGILHVIWSLNIGSGTYTVLTSYNPFHNNCRRDAIITVFVDVITSFLAGLTVFAGTGIIVKDLQDQSNVEFIQKYGDNLAFIVYPEILSRVVGGQYWSVIFFLIVIILGLDSDIWMIETIITEIADKYQSFRSGCSRIVLVGAFCVVSYFLSLMFCLKGNGAILLAMIAHTTQCYAVVLFVLLEVIIVFYVYGYNRFANDVRLILGNKPNLFWQIVFIGSAPLTLLILLIITVLEVYTHPFQFKNEPLPAGYQIFSILLSALITSVVIMFALYRIIKVWIKKLPLSSLILPTSLWSPRKKADLAEQRKEIESAEKGIMGEFELSIELSRKSFKEDVQLLVDMSKKSTYNS